MTNPIHVACRHPTDRVACASLARRFARDVGLDEEGAGAVAIVAAELVSNAVRHGGGGTMDLRQVSEPHPGLELVVSDAGPGIPHPELAVIDGWSRGRLITPDTPRDGLGRGLGAVLRLMHDADIRSDAHGTVITAHRFVVRRGRAV